MIRTSGQDRTLPEDTGHTDDRSMVMIMIRYDRRYTYSSPERSLHDIGSPDTWIMTSRSINIHTADLIPGRDRIRCSWYQVYPDRSKKYSAGTGRMMVMLERR